MNRSREVPVRIIIKRKHDGGHHGGSWKVALADFMTAMFALFLVLWLVNQSSDVKSAIAGYFSDPLGRADEYGSSIMPGEGSTRSSQMLRSPDDVTEMEKDMMIRFADRLQEELAEKPELTAVRQFIEIQMTDDGLRIELFEDSGGVFFETGKPSPSPSGRTILGLLGGELSSARNSVRIEGHTDAHPYRNSSDYTNWELSADRANTARRILTEAGLRPDQVSQVTGYADRMPRNAADPFDQRNRRITITMLFGGERQPGLSR